MAGGPGNPLGARALYLWQGRKDTLYRIHGTFEPWTIGTNVSSRVHPDDQSGRDRPLQSHAGRHKSRGAVIRPDEKNSDRIAGLKRPRDSRSSNVSSAGDAGGSRKFSFVANARLKAPQHTGSHARCDCAILPPLAAAAKAVLPQFAHSFSPEIGTSRRTNARHQGFLDSCGFKGRTRRELCVIRLRCFEAFFPTSGILYGDRDNKSPDCSSRDAGCRRQRRHTKPELLSHAYPGIDDDHVSSQRQVRRAGTRATELVLTRLARERAGQDGSAPVRHPLGGLSGIRVEAAHQHRLGLPLASHQRHAATSLEQCFRAQPAHAG